METERARACYSDIGCLTALNAFWTNLLTRPVNAEPETRAIHTEIKIPLNTRQKPKVAFSPSIEKEPATYDIVYCI